MLFAAAFYQASNGPLAPQIDLYVLKGMAIRSVNASLLSSNRSINDELIGAVVNLAAFEAFFGDRDAYATHMAGLQKIIQLRGGLETLGLDGLLQRILLWVDANASQVTGLNLFFDNNNFPTSIPHPQPNAYWSSAARHDSIATPRAR